MLIVGGILTRDCRSYDDSILYACMNTVVLAIKVLLIIIVIGVVEENRSGLTDNTSVADGNTVRHYYSSVVPIIKKFAFIVFFFVFFFFLLFYNSIYYELSLFIRLIYFSHYIIHIFPFVERSFSRIVYLYFSLYSTLKLVHRVI